MLVVDLLQLENISCRSLIHKYGGKMRKHPSRILYSSEYQLFPHEGGN